MGRLLGLTAGVALAMIAVGTSHAEERLVVVELYTSQGCSSCPPADDIFADLAKRPGVLPLALHVDYWDYIGWKDIFAQPAFTERQKSYARAAGSRTIYTPQIVVGGEDHVVGAKAMELLDLIEAHGDIEETVVLKLTRSGVLIQISAEARGGLGAPVVVQLVRYLPEETVSIERGENAGRTITYTNIVTDWRRLGEWTGEAPLAMEAQAPGDQPTAVILQQEGPGEIIAAAELR